ncbi:uncharacterized protein BDZ99DRAFT_514539 [Mytilinidion resinicola]|uniref:Structure-specific endonuclease subunit SLX4 n=1 Tax=Mytilinidion resinicola TaxID=574789 RepID=A0A6A6Z5G6_9PEZI|nr:uncharacterized protein BDZ99DRAFT_514539 [Mytilinidion resinicola]KAF2815903.1 hypothetical protein BDZ99DRAFT_514539 [Mytilinidion resinicola]
MDASPRRHSTSPSHQQRAAMSPPSSPLPSPSEFFSKKGGGALRSGSKAAPVPDRAFTGSATAGSLIKSRQLSLAAEDLAGEEKPKRQRKQLSEVDANANAPKKASKRSAKASETKPGPDVVAKKPRKRKETIDTTTPNPPPSKSDAGVATTSAPSANALEKADAPVPPKSKPTKPRKPRVPKEKAEAQTKLKKGKITKPGTVSAKSKEIEFTQEYNFESKTTGVKSAHFHPNKEDMAPKMDDTLLLDAGEMINLEIPVPSPRVRDTVLPATVKGTGNDAMDKIAIGEKPTRVDEPLSLDAAVKRRTDWTPTKDTEIIMLDEVTPVNSKVGDSPEAHKKLAFTSIIATYAYANTSEAVTTEAVTRKVSGEALTKRRRIELVDIPSQHPNTEVTKALRKKATTITDLVTGQYKPNGLDDVAAGATSNFFGPRAGVLPVAGAIGNNAKALLAPKPARKRAPREKSPTKADPKTKKGTKQPKSQPKLVADKLLSPSTAARKWNKQEILFGTSSQLARDESPQLIRQIQLAIRESEAEAEANASIHQATESVVSDSIRSKKLSKFTASRTLWSAAARDDDNQFWNPPAPSPRNVHPEIDGSFVDIDTFNDDGDAPAEMTDSEFHSIEQFGEFKEFPSEQQGSGSLPTGDFCNSKDSPAEKQDSGFHYIEEFHDFKDVPRRAESKPPHTASNSIIQLDGPADESRFLDIEDFQRPQVGENQQGDSALAASSHIKLLENREAHATKSQASPSKIPTAKKPRGRPPKSKTTITIPTKKTKRAKSSPKKKTQASRALPSTPPRKKKTLDFVHIDEIQDSEAESPLSPSPPRNRKANAPTLSSPLQLRPSLAVKEIDLEQVKHDREVAEKLKAEKLAAKVEAAKLAEAAMRRDLFPKITTTVKGAPRTTDPSKPSWYEKILMYDPIVLEDLTAWLNAQGVRWFVTIKRKGRGKKKAGEAAGAEDDMEVVEKELEAKMVQNWCEENSICCTYREGTRH